MKIIPFLLFLSLFVTSCIPLTKQNSFDNEILKPPVFSFLEIDPNNTDVNYTNRMTKYNDIIKKCPIPICIIDQKDLHSDFVKLTGLADKNIRLLGLYVCGNDIKGWPEEFIFINRNQSPEKILSTYFHEYTHYIHRDINCYCWAFNETLIQEAHALTNELRLAFDYKLPEVLKSSYASIWQCMIEPNTLRTYRIASLMVSEGIVFNIVRIHLRSSEEKKE